MENAPSPARWDIGLAGVLDNSEKDMSDEPALGWEPEHEDQHSYAIAEMMSPLTCAAPSDIPDLLDVSWFVQQSQGSLPFCHAHGRTACLEYLAWVATKGKVKQFSRRFAAITDMRVDGNDSRPNGASISGSCRASKQFGEADEALFPYFKDGEAYSNQIPDSVSVNANSHRIRSLSPNVRSYDQFDSQMTTGLVACCMGMDWTTGWDALRGCDHINSMPGGRVRGGHALAIFGWQTKAGARHYWLHNSHQGWGVNMKCLLSPEVIDAIFRNSRYGAFLVSDIELKDEPAPRPWDWLDTANFAGGGLKLDLGTV